MVASLYQLLVAIPKNLTVFLLKKEKGHFKAYSGMLIWHLKHLFSKKIHENPRL
jgi:hypothetical protein